MFSHRIYLEVGSQIKEVFILYAVVKKILFLFPAEMAHQFGMFGVRAIGFLFRIGLWPRPKWADVPSLKRQSPFGEVASPLGLAAGFDKNAVALWGWYALGFGFVEIGTVTPLPQAGNPRPRLHRFPFQQALINRMGFNNNGTEQTVRRLKKARENNYPLKIGGNIGKNFSTPIQDAPADYAKAAAALVPYIDYLVINVSSPNTPGLRGLQTEETLSEIVQKVKQVSGPCPIFVKVAPDDFADYFAGVENSVKKFKLAGVICGNTLANRSLLKTFSEAEIKNLPAGGISGDPVFSENLRLCQAYSHASPFVIGVGGISETTKAKKYLTEGAQLIQIYTGLVFRGPGLVKELLKSLA